MTTSTRTLGTLETANALINDLYLDLRKRTRQWAAITKQTSQARMGYVGQHLVSVVTGYPGTRTGARGADLVLPEGKEGEIKTCYRVDQLGKCRNTLESGRVCNNGVGPDEKQCSACGSSEIQRKDDSKWLISFRDENELAHALDPAVYYLVLFEFTDLDKPDTICTSIWSIDPRVPGFSLCIVDYFYNIRANSTSHAPLNIWPYRLKFELMRPTLIYQSTIKPDDSIDTRIFPGRVGREERHPLSRMNTFARTDISQEEWIQIAKSMGGWPPAPTSSTNRKSKTSTKLIRRQAQQHIEDLRISDKISDDDMCDRLARGFYGKRIEPFITNLPKPLKDHVQNALKPSR